MSELLDLQHRFSRMIPGLLDAAHGVGYEVSLKHLLRCDDCKVGHPRSAHKSGLALDIVLFRGGAVVTDEQPYAALHDHWDARGGAARIEGDLGHFSLEWGGVR